VGTITANQAVNVSQWGGSNIATPAVMGEPVVTLGATQAAYAPAIAGDKMDLTDSLKNKAGASGYDRTTDSLEALGEGGGGGSSAEDIDIRLTAYHGAGTWAGTNKVSVSYPLTPDVDMSIVRGDDYNNSDSRAITFTLTNAPNLTGAAIKLYANMPTVFEKSMTVVTGGTGTQVVRLELSATETAAFTVGTFGYDIRAVLVTSLRVVTLISRSKLIVTEKIA